MLYIKSMTINTYKTAVTTVYMCIELTTSSCIIRIIMNVLLCWMGVSSFTMSLYSTVFQTDNQEFSSQ